MRESISCEVIGYFFDHARAVPRNPRRPSALAAVDAAVGRQGDLRVEGRRRPGAPARDQREAGRSNAHRRNDEPAVAARNRAIERRDRRAPAGIPRQGRRQPHRRPRRREPGTGKREPGALMRESVIVSAVRTPTGKFLGALKGFTATELGARVVAEAVRRAGIDPQIVDECIMGNVVSAGLGQSPARQAALRGGLPDHVAALTINKVCGSVLKTVILVDQAIRVGDIDVAVAGGMESMSNCPYLLPRVRDGLRMGNGEIVDSMINDGLWCSFEQCHMGNAGEVVAEHYNVGREAQDHYAAESHRKAARATDSGAFKDEMLPIAIPQKKGDAVGVDRDEPIRADTTPQSLGALKPAFKKDGTDTAGTE